MRGATFSLVAVAPPRTEWLTRLTAWANEGSLGVEVVRCISIEEMRARIGSMQRFSAALIDESSVGLDRDLLMASHENGSAPIVVSKGITRRDWESLGASGTITDPFDAEALLHVLRTYAEPTSQNELGHQPEPQPIGIIQAAGAPPTPLAPLVAVVGGGGTGTSTAAIALAQGFSSTFEVTLVDASLDGSLALMLGSTELVPALQQLVEAHRLATPQPEDLRSFLHQCPNHPFTLVPGLRRHRDWTSLSTHAVRSAITSLRQTCQLLVADVDPDLEGEAETGSFDISDRNALSRIIITSADAVLVTGRPDLVGVSRLLRIVTDLIELGVAVDRIRVVVLLSGRSVLGPGEIRRGVDQLIRERRPSLAPPPTAFVELPKGLDGLMLDARPLPGSFAASLRSIVEPVLGSGWSTPATSDPLPIAPGSLGIAS
jgi:hypothetical protein